MAGATSFFLLKSALCLSALAPDSSNRVLARHYGFTDDELDFIINYDIKYRMGRESGEEE